MLSDDLIAGLATDLKPVRARSAHRDLLVLAGVGGLEVVLFLAVGSARPDFTGAAALPMLWWKLATLATLAAIGIATAVASFAPDRSPRFGLRLITAVVALSLAAGLVLGLGHGFMGSLIERLDWRHGVQCLGKMVALSLPPVIALAVLARRGAPIDRGGTALSAGIGAAAWGAFVFAFACPADDPLYIAWWYLLGCGITALATRFVLYRMMRW